MLPVLNIQIIRRLRAYISGSTAAGLIVGISKADPPGIGKPRSYGRRVRAVTRYSLLVVTLSQARPWPRQYSSPGPSTRSCRLPAPRGPPAPPTRAHAAVQVPPVWWAVMTAGFLQRIVMAFFGVRRWASWRQGGATFKEASVFQTLPYKHHRVWRSVDSDGQKFAHKEEMSRLDSCPNHPSLALLLS